jgi:iron complex transport system substrate-binding protein
MLKDLLQLGEKTGTLERARGLAREATERVSKIAQATQALPPVKTFFMEWVDPLFCGGHWIPEMVRWAGGIDEIAKPNQDSIRVAWDEVLQSNPEVLIVSPCGYGIHDSLKQAELLKARPGWNDLAAVKKNRVYAVDGNAYFARPGLRLVEGVELLAHLLHPSLFPWKGPTGAFEKLLTAGS